MRNRAYSLSVFCSRENGGSRENEVFRESGGFNIGGPNDIISLAQLDKNLSPIKTYKLIGASIRNSGSLEYNIAEGAGAVVNFSTTFAYHYYTIE